MAGRRLGGNTNQKNEHVMCPFEQDICVLNRVSGAKRTSQPQPELCRWPLPPALWWQQRREGWNWLWRARRHCNSGADRCPSGVIEKKRLNRLLWSWSNGPAVFLHERAW